MAVAVACWDFETHTWHLVVFLSVFMDSVHLNVVSLRSPCVSLRLLIKLFVVVLQHICSYLEVFLVPFSAYLRSFWVSLVVIIVIIIISVWCRFLFLLCEWWMLIVLKTAPWRVTEGKTFIKAVRVIQHAFVTDRGRPQHSINQTQTKYGWVIDKMAVFSDSSSQILLPNS